MSRTDKTRPYWVQMRDPLFPWGKKLWHWHYHDHECHPEFPMPPTRRHGGRNTLRRGGCQWWPKYGDHEKIFGRSGWRRTHPGQEGRARAAARRLITEWIKTAADDREDIDSYQDAPSQRWLWRKWYWD